MRTHSHWFKRVVGVVVLIAVCGLGACAAPPTSPTPAASEFIFGVILVGPYNDHGWSEAHYTAGLYVEKNLKSRMLYLDSLNADSRPNVTLEQAVNDMAAQGARLIFLTSDEFAADAYVVAQKHPTVTFIHVSGDHALKDKAPANVGNVMGRMEEGKMIAGCAAALATRTGYIGYLGPLINDETRRLANSAYLGARYCYEHYRRQNPAKLRFRVDWIGFWFNIPNVTFDPTQVTNQFFDQGADVVMSGIDTTEAIVVTGQRATAGEQVWVVPYDYERACEAAPQVCLGVPYFNWGPAYLKLARQVAAGNWKREWEWLEPDWQDINNRDTSAVGFRRGAALTAEQSAYLDKFIAGLANRSIILFKGPLNFQNGQIFLNDKELASDTQIWYMPHLLAGMEGLSE